MSLFPQFSKPEIHHKVWGREIWICNNEQYCGKILEFNAGASMSMHYHLLKKEHFHILSGDLEFSYIDLDKGNAPIKAFLKIGDVVEIKPGTLHKIKAITDCRIMEVSTQHFENDSYRIEPSKSPEQNGYIDSKWNKEELEKRNLHIINKE